MSVEPDHGPAAGGAKVTVRGRNFGSETTALSVTIGELPAHVLSVSESVGAGGLQSVVLRTPAGSTHDAPVRVYVLQQQSALSKASVFSKQPSGRARARTRAERSGGAGGFL